MSDIGSESLSLPEPPDDLPIAAGPLDRHRLADLIEQIKESADKLAADHTTHGDLKILSRTLRELRYAFKVFTPYRSRRKVTVFGSARTRPADPAYQQAVAFGRAMAAARLAGASPAPPAASWRPGTSAPAAKTRWG